MMRSGKRSAGDELRNTGQLIVFQPEIPNSFRPGKRWVDGLFPVHFRRLTVRQARRAGCRGCKNDAVTTAGPGRPRKQQPSRPGATARDEILDAAAELFTTRGYATTSTRSIAEAVGIRQSSLYHHFSTKDDILEVLLAGTVAGGLSFARAVCSGNDGDGSPAAAGARLHAVALYDGTQLCDARWNLGVLYHLPEARGARFRSFMDDRRELRGLYQRLGAELPDNGWTSTGQNGELAFRLVESLVSLRADGLSTPGSPLQAADAGMVLSGLGENLPVIRAQSAALLARIAG
ncbi:MAG: Transcriptional regulator, TetR family [Arthrobacter sp.]|nr:Transcriptional regulator, TetR family [Arthrobacter sp.]MCU1548095.1 Transcriptional regulator, TetR family [Arthrobacter sp.]